MYVAVDQKRQTIQDGRQRMFEQNIFLTNNPIINCNMSYLINFEHFEHFTPFLDPKLQLEDSMTFKHHMKVKKSIIAVT